MVQRRRNIDVTPRSLIGCDKRISRETPPRTRGKVAMGRRLDFLMQEVQPRGQYPGPLQGRSTAAAPRPRRPEGLISSRAPKHGAVISKYTGPLISAAPLEQLTWARANATRPNVYPSARAFLPFVIAG